MYELKFGLDFVNDFSVNLSYLNDFFGVHFLLFNYLISYLLDLI